MSRRRRSPAPGLTDIVAHLEAREEQLAARIEDGTEASREIVGVREALEALRGRKASSAPPPIPRGRRGRKRRPVAGKAPKRSKRRRKPKPEPKRKASSSKRAAPKRLAPDEPRSVKGRLPTKDVERHVCEDQADRRAKVGQLRAEGYARVAGGVPLSPGSFDVRENDAHGVILWRPKADEE